MNHLLKMVTFLLMGLFFANITLEASAQDLPVIKGKKIVAIINGEPITLDQFNRELMAIRKGTGETKGDGKENLQGLLNRLINTRLIIQEAKRMGLDRLKEVKMQVEVFSRTALREELIERQIKNIKPDEREVEKAYQEFIKEWKIKSILFEKEEDAKRMEKGLKEGKDFDQMVKTFLKNQIGKVEEGKEFLKHRELLPEIAEVISKMKKGSTSPVVKIKSGFVIFRLEDLRYPNDPKVKEEVRREVLRQKQIEAIEKYEKNLIEKYAKVNRPLIKRLDFESRDPGFDKLLKDNRVVAEIKGERSITVGDLADSLKKNLFHGVERAIETKQLNRKKNRVLEEMVRKRVLKSEALRLGIDKTESYQNRVREYENALLFETFIQKAVIPDIKLKEEEVQKYYDRHIKDYTYPEMMKLRELIFSKREDAEKALIRLRQGADFQWLKANAEGQIDRNTKGLLTFEGNLLMTKELPEPARKALSGAKKGDFRLFESPEHYFYVLWIEDVVPSRPKPYSESREMIARKVFGDKLKKAVEEYASKLRAASEVKVYLKD